jgi:hypothetical protein
MGKFADPFFSAALRAGIKGILRSLSSAISFLRGSASFRPLHLIIVLLAVWLTFNWYDTIRHVARYYTPFPTYDYWRVVEDFSGHDPSGFWRQHNEHRIIFPELIFAFDYVFLRGRQILPLVISVMCYAAVWILLAETFWRDRLVSREIRILAFLFGGVVMGWPLSAFVLGIPFLLQWTLMQLAVVLALRSIGRLKETDKPVFLAAAVICGFIASFSSANGLLIWPIALIISAVLKLRKNHVLFLALSFVLCLGTFLIGYHLTSSSDLFDAIKHPIRIVGFVISYISMPFGVLRNPVIGFAFGSLGLLVWAYLFLRAIRCGSFRLLSTVVPFGYFAFLLLTSLVTATGRLELADGGFVAAKAPRYLTVSLAGWALLLQSALNLSGKEKWKVFSPGIIVLLAGVVLLFMQLRLGRWLRTNDDFMANQQWAILSVENGLFDASFIKQIFPDPAFVKHYLPEMRRNRLTIYADKEWELIGAPLDSRFDRSHVRQMGGEVTGIIPVQSSVGVTGWAAEQSDIVLFVNDSGIIAGFARRLPAGFPKGLLPSNTPPSQAWAGFINLHLNNASFRCYAANLNRSKVAQVGGITRLAKNVDARGQWQ